MRRGARTAAAAALAAASVTAGVAASELWHWRASRSAPGAADLHAPGSRAIVVLGFPSRHDGGPHAMQKWRTEIAVRSRPQAAEHVLVFTGGRSRGAKVAEAETMAAHARSLGIPAVRILLETEAANTWENLSLALPMTDAFGWVVLVSDPLHAVRARRYAVEQRPDIAGRLLLADDYRFLERWWLKAPVALYELAALVRDRVRQPHREKGPGNVHRA